MIIHPPGARTPCGFFLLSRKGYEMQVPREALALIGAASKDPATETPHGAREPTGRAPAFKRVLEMSYEEIKSALHVIDMGLRDGKLSAENAHKMLCALDDASINDIVTNLSPSSIEKLKKRNKGAE